MADYRHHANIDIIFANLLNLLLVDQFRTFIPANAVAAQAFLENLDYGHTYRTDRPLISRIKIITTATTSKIWIKPPSV